MEPMILLGHLIGICMICKHDESAFCREEQGVVVSMVCTNRGMDLVNSMKIHPLKPYCRA